MTTIDDPDTADADRLETAVVVYPGVDELHAVGPHERLASAGDRGDPFDVSLLALDPVDRVTAGHGLGVDPDGSSRRPLTCWSSPVAGGTTGRRPARGALSRREGCPRRSPTPPRQGRPSPRSAPER
jgi:hypothetical protein